MVKAVRTKRPVRFETLEDGDHFLHDGMPDRLMAALERCIPQRRALSFLDFTKSKSDPANAA